MGESIIEFSWPLGDDLDCDLCGWTYNEVGLEFWDPSVRLAELQARPARCASGHSTCTWAHLGAGAQCEGGVCRVHARDVAEATGGVHG